MSAHHSDIYKAFDVVRLDIRTSCHVVKKMFSGQVLECRAQKEKTAAVVKNLKMTEGVWIAGQRVEIPKIEPCDDKM